MHAACRKRCQIETVQHACADVTSRLTALPAAQALLAGLTQAADDGPGGAVTEALGNAQHFMADLLGPAAADAQLLAQAAGAQLGSAGSQAVQTGQQLAAAVQAALSQLPAGGQALLPEGGGLPPLPAGMANIGALDGLQQLAAVLAPMQGPTGGLKGGQQLATALAARIGSALAQGLPSASSGGGRRLHGAPPPPTLLEGVALHILPLLCALSADACRAACPQTGTTRVASGTSQLHARLHECLRCCRA